MSLSILDHRGDVLKTIHTDAHDPYRMVEATTQDVDSLIEHARLQRELRGEDMSKCEEGMVLAGYIPDVVAERMIREGSFHDEEALRRWLNDPQNACFRVWKGRV